jgi:uncharacterized membrane protein YdcZ (DUF606 family)
VAGKEAFSRESERVATWPYYLFAVVAGAMLPFQFGINSVLARYVDGAARASLVSFVVGTLALLVAVTRTRHARTPRRHRPRRPRRRTRPRLLA